MSVRIRMARTGRTNRPFFRVCVYDARTRRDGSPIEQIGHYDPLVKEFEKAVVLDVERAIFWISKGAKVSETVASFLKKKGAVLQRNVVKGGNRSKGKAKGSGAAAKAAKVAKAAKPKAAKKKA